MRGAAVEGRVGAGGALENVDQRAADRRAQAGGFAGRGVDGGEEEVTSVASEECGAVAGIHNAHTETVERSYDSYAHLRENRALFLSRFVVLNRSVVAFIDVYG